MANPFGMFKEYVDKPKRNIFDLSFQNNLTLDYGYIYPIFCKEVVPGDSMRISPRMAFNFMPTAFPIQTRQRAYMQFFYVRNRTLWKDWMDFIGKTKDGLVKPYMDFSGQTPKTGSLYDYMGLPTTLVGSFGRSLSFTSQKLQPDTDQYAISIVNSFKTPGSYFQISAGLLSTNNLFVSASGTLSGLNNIIASCAGISDEFYNLKGDADLNVLLSTLLMGTKTYFIFKYEFDVDSDDFSFYNSLDDDDAVSLNIPSYVGLRYSDSGFNGAVNVVLSDSSYDAVYRMSSYTDSYVSSSFKASAVKSIIKNAGTYFLYVFCELPNFYALEDRIETFKEYFDVTYPVGSGFARARFLSSSDDTFSSFTTVTQNDVSVVEIDKDTSPYYDSSSSRPDSQIRIDALPFRAYESICNCYFRDDRNNPFILNGVPEYNRYVTTLEGGADKTKYTLYRRNWEQDFLTTAVQSPQQGIAPLVGITSTGEMTFADDDGKLYRAKANVSQDGNTIESFSVLSSDMPSGNLRALVDMASSGIGINDLRNVNALQKWLETNIRRGYKYRDQIMSHYGVDVRYDELDMPEFIGGMSEDVSVRQVNNTSVADGSTLGDYAGQMFIGASGGRTITHYCDEHGFIIGLLSIVPVPVYSQLLSKQFLKMDVLDYYFPEFGHIGMQPITYDQVAPVQVYNAEPGSLNSEFGYQRSWYEYLSSVDECHGLFRTDLQNFLMNRVFNDKPELSEEFLKVDPEQLNKVFTVTKYGNKILGNIYFQVEAKRPIPLYGIPSLI